MGRILNVAVVSCILAVTAGAQTKRSGPSSKPAIKVAKRSAAPYTGLSTMNGVYTAEQAVRGRDVYMGSCKSCHSPESHTGAMFASWWRGKQLSDLYSFIAFKMPKNNPGSLAPEDAADVVAYLLRMNKLPTGPDELYPEPDSLKKYRIETKRSRATTTAKRTKP